MRVWLIHETTPTRRGKAGTASGDDVSKDLKTFEALPEKPKVLARLQDETGKPTSPASVTLHKKVKITASV